MKKKYFLLGRWISGTENGTCSLHFYGRNVPLSVRMETLDLKGFTNMWLVSFD